MGVFIEKLRSGVLLKILGIPADGDSSRDWYDSYLRAEETKKDIEEYMKEAKEILFGRAVEEGTPNSKGSYTIRFPEGGGFQKQARTRVEISFPKVKELNDKKDLGLIKLERELIDNLDIRDRAFRILEGALPEAIVNIEVVDEEAIEEAFIDGKIGDEEMGRIIDRKVTYALVKVK